MEFDHVAYARIDRDHGDSFEQSAAPTNTSRRMFLDISEGDAESLVARIQTTAFTDANNEVTHRRPKKLKFAASKAVEVVECASGDCFTRDLTEADLSECGECNESFCDKCIDPANHSCGKYTLKIPERKKKSSGEISSASSGTGAKVTTSPQSESNLCQARCKRNKSICSNIATQECSEYECLLLLCDTHIGYDNHRCDGAATCLARKALADAEYAQNYENEQQPGRLCNFSACGSEGLGYDNCCSGCQKIFCITHLSTDDHSCRGDKPAVCDAKDCEFEIKGGCRVCMAFFCSKHIPQVEHRCKYCLVCETGQHGEKYEAKKILDGERKRICGCECCGRFCQVHIDQVIHRCKQTTSSSAVVAKRLVVGQAAAAAPIPAKRPKTKRFYCFVCGYDKHWGKVCPVMTGVNRANYTKNMRNAEEHCDLNDHSNVKKSGSRENL